MTAARGLLSSLLLVHLLQSAAGLQGHSSLSPDAEEFEPAEGPPDPREPPPNKTVLVVINVHERPDVAQLQWKNINRHFEQCSLKPQVLLSCNEAMHGNLSAVKEKPHNVHLNPEIIEKRRFSGTILHGIISNLRFYWPRVPYRYVLVMSSRSKIFKDITEDDFEASLTACNDTLVTRCSLKKTCWLQKCEAIGEQKGFWPAYEKTKLAELLLAHGLKPQGPVLAGGPHEGLVLERVTVRRILRFLDKHPSIEQALFDAWEAPMEEFALHTLALSVGGRFGYLGRDTTDLGKESFYKIGRVARTTVGFPPHEL